MHLTFTATLFSLSLFCFVSVCVDATLIVNGNSRDPLRHLSVPHTPIFTTLLRSFDLADALQFFLIPVVLGEGWVPLILANALYAGALSWYWYITHLGYRTLPFLSNTEVFLFPIAAILLVFVTMLVGHPFGFGWNAARVMTRFYFT